MQFKNPNIAGEMAQMMVSNQAKYVPSFITPNQLNAPDHPERKEVLGTVGYHGDQLFEERARNVQWTFRVGNSCYERLEGLSTEFADWHAKVTLYKV